MFWGHGSSSGRRWCCTRDAGVLQLYMASSDSSGLSGFLRFGVPCATPGSPLGGEGMPGVISAALALSSRNLSNSGRRWMRWRVKAANAEVGGAKRSLGRRIKGAVLLPYLRWLHLLHRHRPSVGQQRRQTSENSLASSNFSRMMLKLWQHEFIHLSKQSNVRLKTSNACITWNLKYIIIIVNYNIFLVFCLFFLNATNYRALEGTLWERKKKQNN